MKVAITGHRSKRIGNKSEEVRLWIDGQLKNLKACYDDLILINGMTDGVDQMAALSAIQNGIDLDIYFPYKRKNAGRSSLREFLMDSAHSIRYICEGFRKDCYFIRDRRMVDDCDLLLVVWDGKPFGGAYYTYSYALEKGKDILMYPWKK